MTTIDEAKGALRKFEDETMRKIKELYARYPDLRFNFSAVTQDSIDSRKPPIIIDVRAEFIIY